MELLPNEISLPIPISGLESKFSITDFGRVYFHPRTGENGHYYPGKWMENTPLSLGYKRIPIFIGGKKTISPKVHKMVATLFVSNPHQFEMINHKDGNELNNHFSNLEWCSLQQNVKHAQVTGLLTHKQHSKYWGVSADTDGRKKKYRAVIRIQGVNKTLGHFLTEKEAAIVYNEFIQKNNLPHLLNRLD